MKLANLTPDEIELMSYTDLTYLLLKENKKTMNTPTIFREICNLLGYSDDDYANKIGDYYTSLTIDKRFILLPSNEWDIRDNHSVEIVVEEDDEDEEIEEEATEEVTEEENDDIEEEIDDEETVYDDDDDLADLSIVDDEDISAE